MKYGTFYLVRQVGTTEFEKGTGNYAVPKLYTKGSANGLVSRRNREARQGETYEAVPVEIVGIGSDLPMKKVEVLPAWPFPVPKAKPVIPQPANEDGTPFGSKPKTIKQTLAQLLGL